MLIDLLFPRRCVVCSSEGGWLCQKCGNEMTVGAQLENISEDSWALYPFENRAVRELLHNLKYNGVDEIAGKIVALTKSWLPAGEVITGAAILVPVPTSKATLKRRGYNQAELIARAIGGWLNVPVETRLLEKMKRGTSVGKTAVERLQSATGSFAISLREDWKELRQKQLIIIDDIMTTGSTLAACRELLAPLSQFPVKSLVVARKH